ncbi:MAG: hypothetical protein AAF568_12905, partial [Pseudomonadota bacterium]
MHLVLHLGPHKTGSTYVQMVLAENAERLAAAGWIYPQAGRSETEMGHHTLALGWDAFQGAGLATLRAETAGAAQVILSAEALCNWEPARFQALAEALGAARVTLVYYLRDPNAWAFSRWQHQRRYGKAEDLPDWWARMFRNPQARRQITPMLHLESYAALGSRFQPYLIGYDHLRST